MFFKYKDQLAKLDESQKSTVKTVSCIIVQSLDTHTHLPMNVNKTELIEVNNAQVMTAENFIQSLNNDGEYLEDLYEAKRENSTGSKRLMKNLITITLIRASKDEIWISDLHEGELESHISNCIKSFEI